MPPDHHSTIEPWFECQEAVILPHSDGKISLNPTTVGHFWKSRDFGNSRFARRAEQPSRGSLWLAQRLPGVLRSPCQSRGRP